MVYAVDGKQQIEETWQQRNPNMPSSMVSRFLLLGVLGLGLFVSHSAAQDIRVSDMSFVDDLHGWVTVQEPAPAVYRTCDGGKTWDRFTVPPKNGFYLIRFFDHNTGFALEIESEKATAIYRTRDAGETWTKINEVRASYYLIFGDLYLTSASEGFLVGEGESGTGHVVQLLGAGETLKVRKGEKELVHLAKYPHTSGVFGDGTGHLWIVGGDLILHSADGGKTWKNQSVKTMESASSGAALPGGLAWIAADKEIYKTNDYGKHWVVALTVKNKDDIIFSGVSFANPNEGCAVGNSSHIYCTKDGGVTWSKSSAFNAYPEGSPFFSRLQIFGSSRGWTSIDGAVYRTESGGRSFTEVLTATAPVKSDIPGEFQALKTWINGPADLAYDAEGFLYIAEQVQERLLRLDVKHGSIKVTLPEPEGGLWKDFDYPNAVAADEKGNLFIADFNGRLRKLDTHSGDITVLLPAPQTEFEGRFDIPPVGIAGDGKGNLLISEDHKLLRWQPGATKLEVIAGTGDGAYDGDGGPAIKAKLNWPEGIAVRDNGDIFVADSGNCRIRKIDAKTLIITTIAGTGECASKGDGGPAVKAAIDSGAITIDHKGNLFLVDSECVRRIDSQGIITTYAGTGKGGESGDGGQADKAELDAPSGIALDAEGGLHIGEYHGNRVRYVNAVTHIITTVAGDGKPERVDIQM